MIEDTTDSTADDATTAADAQAATDATDATAQAAADAVQPQAAERPEWLPEKFWKDGAASYEDMAKSYKSLEAKLGQRAPAAPAAPTDYQLKPQDWPADQPWNEDAAGKLATTFHTAGLTQEQAAAVGAAIIEMERESQKSIAEGSVGAIDEAVAKLEEDRIAAHNKAVTEGMANLRKEWGHEYDSRLSDIKQIASNLGFDVKDPDLFGSAAVIKMLGKFTSLIGEDSAAILRGGTLKSPGFADGVAEANAIIADPKHPDHAAYRSGDRRVINKVNALMRQGL